MIYDLRNIYFRFPRISNLPCWTYATLTMNLQSSGAARTQDRRNIRSCMWFIVEFRNAVGGGGEVSWISLPKSMCNYFNEGHILTTSIVPRKVDNLCSHAHLPPPLLPPPRNEILTTLMAVSKCRKTELFFSLRLLQKSWNLQTCAADELPKIEVLLLD